MSHCISVQKSHSQICTFLCHTMTGKTNQKNHCLKKETCQAKIETTTRKKNEKKTSKKWKRSKAINNYTTKQHVLSINNSLAHTLTLIQQQKENAQERTHRRPVNIDRTIGEETTKRIAHKFHQSIKSFFVLSLYCFSLPSPIVRLLTKIY